ncbi:MAG: DUF4258 domain-containing protein [Propionibacteriaceae bacterium]|jgi:hypothetical protein|nr:DUF4258 domain-containing protein [Propionibacteriaceae bacterium]
MHFETIEWDDTNLDHATRRASVLEIEQAIQNADALFRHRIRDRALIRSRTDGGRRLVIVVQLNDNGRRVRPITAWEEQT